MNPFSINCPVCEDRPSGVFAIFAGLIIGIGWGVVLGWILWG